MLLTAKENFLNQACTGFEPQSSLNVRNCTWKFSNRHLPTAMLKGLLWDIQHYATCENATRELRCLLTAIKLGSSKIVCLYSMFDSHRQLFITVYGATWLLAIGKCACRVNVTFMVPFMRAVMFIVGHCVDVSVVYLFLQKQSLIHLLGCCFLVCSFNKCSMLSCFFSLSPHLTNSNGSQPLS
jgi:hypothetical protein